MQALDRAGALVAAIAPAPVALPLLLVVQFALAASYTHAGFALGFSAVQLVLLYAIASSLGGRVFALFAGAVWAIGPAYLSAKYFVVGGSPPTNFGPIFHHTFLPIGYGYGTRAPIVAGILLLASAWLSLVPRFGELLTGAAAGAVAATASLVDPHVWPAVLAPVLGLVAARRFRAGATCLVVVLAGFGALELFRYVPGYDMSYNLLRGTLVSIREWIWSTRLIEYVPLAGLLGIAIRSVPAGAVFGWLLITVVVFPMSEPFAGGTSGFVDLLVRLLPGLPVYAFLAGCIALLIPRGRAAPVRDPATA